MTEIVELVTPEVMVMEAAAGLEIIEVAAQGPRGPQGDPGEKGDPGSFDGTVADVVPDPLLLFENALI